MRRPNDMQSCLIFHYNLKFYDSDEDSFDSVSLKRFVMQSVIGNIVAFRVHAPCSGAFLLDIFANAVTPQEYLTGEPMKFKSVCKFKVSERTLYCLETIAIIISYFSLRYVARNYKQLWCLCQIVPLASGDRQKRQDYSA
jgi:hypothetical protein